MSKKLKKRIIELSGLEGLSKEERVKRVNALLTDQEYKQKLCNKVPGLDFKSIDKCLRSIISQNKPKVTEEDKLRETNPEKFGEEERFMPIKLMASKESSYYNMYTIEETNKLVNAKPVGTNIKSTPLDPTSYLTYTKEETSRLVADMDEYINKTKSTQKS